MGKINLYYDKDKKDCPVTDNDVGASSANRGELSDHPRTDTQMSFVDQMATISAAKSMKYELQNQYTCSFFLVTKYGL